MSDIPSSTGVELEILCSTCQGRGVVEHGHDVEICEECAGAGFIPTELGEQILTLVRHNVRPLLGDAGLPAPHAVAQRRDHFSVRPR